MMVVAERVMKEAESGLAATGTIDGNMRAKKRVTCAV
jgi:hypothetical protein